MRKLDAKGRVDHAVTAVMPVFELRAVWLPEHGKSVNQNPAQSVSRDIHSAYGGMHQYSITYVPRRSSPIFPCPIFDLCFIFVPDFLLVIILALCVKAMGDVCYSSPSLFYPFHCPQFLGLHLTLAIGTVAPIIDLCTFAALRFHHGVRCL
jgi:hypothetical protein